MVVFGVVVVAVLLAIPGFVLVDEIASDDPPPVRGRFVIDGGRGLPSLVDLCAEAKDEATCVRTFGEVYPRWQVGELRFGSLERARAFVHRETDRLLASRRRPHASDYYSANARSDGGCTSSGLKDYEQWSSGSQMLRIDLDGDGRRDRFIEYQIGDYSDSAQSPTHWLRAELATGAKIDQRLDSWMPGRMFGSSDLNDDGRPEIWFHVGGFTAWQVGMAVFADCAPRPVLEQFEADDRSLRWHEMSLQYAASGQSSATVEQVGVECTDLDGDGIAEIVETQQHRPHPDPAFRGPDDRYSWHYSAFRLEGARIIMVDGQGGSERKTRPDKLKWSGGLDCDEATDR
jgi:hypothetical protein